MRRGFILVLGLLVFPLFFANHSTVQALSKGLEPTADTFVNEDHPNTNYGGESTLDLLDGLVGDETLIFIMFDLSELPSDAKISEVTLRLYTAFVTSTRNIGVHWVSNTTWDEVLITYNDKPSYAATAIDTKNVEYEHRWYEWNVTSVVPEEITTKDIFCWALKIETLTGNYADIKFYSNDVELSFAEKPELKVVYSSSEELLFYVMIALTGIAAIVGITVFLVKRRKVKPRIEPKVPEMLKETVFCPYCGVQNAASSKFCISCGKDLTTS